MARKSIQVIPHGGLGNQFFTYYAGLVSAKDNNCPLDIYLGKCDRQHADRIYDISAFNLDLNGGKFIKPRLIDLPKFKLIRRCIDSMIFRIDFIRFIHSVVLGHLIEGRDFSTQGVHKFDVGSKVEGYFNSFEYFQLLNKVTHVKMPKLCNPSFQFTQMLSRMSETNYISLHLRRGDATNYKNSIGNLSFEYYQNAMKAVPDKFKELPLFIFSDDLIQARELAASLNWHDIRVISGISDPAENFTLFSKGKILIIANLSYSVWASLLSDSQEKIMAPYPFLRSSSWPEIWPSSWSKQPSKWE